MTPEPTMRNSLLSLTVTTKSLTMFLPSVTDTVQMMVSVVTVRRSTAVRMMPSPARSDTDTDTDKDTDRDTDNDTHTDINSDTYKDTNNDTHTDTDSDTDKNTENDTHTNIVTQIKTQ